MKLAKAGIHPKGMRELCDDDLLKLAQGGNEAAFEELMRRNSSTSFKLAVSILKDRDAAEDEVQNSYWNAWRSITSFKGDSKFSTWISRIVINQCLMQVRRAKRASFQYLDEGSEGSEVRSLELADTRSDPEQELQSRETAARLRSEIRKLPASLRNVLVLRDLDELEMADVSERLGISIVAAKSRLLRARTELRRRMERHLAVSAAQ